MTGKLITYTVAFKFNALYKIKNLFTDFFYYIKSSLSFWFEDISRLWKSVDLSNFVLALEITLSSFLLCWKRGYDALQKRTNMRNKMNGFRLQTETTLNVFDWARLRLTKGIFYNKDISLNESEMVTN